MNTTDVNVWKELLQELLETSDQNNVILSEIREEIERQKQRNKKEVQQVAFALEKQKGELESLIQELQESSLFSMPGDKDALDSFVSTITAQLDKTNQLLNYTNSMLEAGTTSPELIEKIRVGSRSGREKSHAYLPKLFRKEHLLGNWIHYFDNSTFTCQSFWDDNTFKEYDFEEGMVVGEREGTYEIESGDVKLAYANGKKDEYFVTGFSDERIDYLIHGSAVQFDYMPESLLNDFLDADSGNEK